MLSPRVIAGATLLQVALLIAIVFAAHPVGQNTLAGIFRAESQAQSAPVPVRLTSPQAHTCPPASVIEKEVVVEKVVEKEIEKVVLQTSAPTLQPSWYGTVDESVAAAKAMLGEGIDTSNRMLIPLLTARHDRLCCFFSNFRQNAFNTTAADVFVFSIGNEAQAAVEAACPDEVKASSVHFMALAEFWESPWEAGDVINWVEFEKEQIDNEEWVEGFKNYRRMGHWRLLFPGAFAAALGYPFYWQLDDDSHLNGPVDMNLVDFAKSKHLDLAAHELTGEPAFVTWGLPEIAKWFIISEKMEVATLFEKHCQPPDLSGLYTTATVDTVNKTYATTGEGWDGTVLYGNCVLVSVDFWMREDVQKFVRLVIASGGHSRFRWNEQAVMGMIWQMFVPEDRFTLLPIPHEHRRGCDGEET